MTSARRIPLQPLLCALIACFGVFGQTCSDCVPTWTLGTPALQNGCNQPYGDSLGKQQPYTISWPDGTSGTKTGAGVGECLGNEDCNYLDTVNCWPYFNGPTASSGYWQEIENDGVAEFVGGVHGCPNNSLQGENLACTAGTARKIFWSYTCNCPCTGSPTFMCSTSGGIGYASPTCQDGQFVCPSSATQCSLPPPSGGCPAGQTLTCGGDGQAIGGNWTCNCNPNCGTCPILIDTQDQGFHLTDWQHGVTFGFFPGQSEIQLAWTDANYANAGSPWTAMGTA
jgi:hypothetical protein